MGIHGLVVGAAQFLLALLSGGQDAKGGQTAEDYATLELRGTIVQHEDGPPDVEGFGCWERFSTSPQPTILSVDLGRDLKQSWRLEFGGDALLKYTACCLQEGKVIVTGEPILPGQDGYGFSRGKVGLGEPVIWVKSIRPASRPGR
jgi:hypothetical protein